MGLKATKEKRGLAFKEFALGEKSKYWVAKRNKFNAVQLGKTACVSEITIRRWWKEYIGQLKDDKVVDDGIMVGKLKTMESKKKYALYIFNLGNNSRYWDEKVNKININKLSKSTGIGEWTARHWYAQWELDHNTTLEYVQLSPEELNANKEEYFKELASGAAETTFKTMAKYHITSQVLKNWIKEYKSGCLHGENRLDVIDKSSVQNNVKPQEQTIEETVKKEEQNHPEKSSIEVVDNVGNKLSDKITSITHFSDTKIETYSDKNQEYMYQIAYGASKVVVGGRRVSPIKESGEYSIDLKTLPVPAGEKIYYRCMCTSGGETCTVLFRYHYHN
jgi:hypothetical protein